MESDKRMRKGFTFMRDYVTCEINDSEKLESAGKRDSPFSKKKRLGYLTATRIDDTRVTHASCSHQLSEII
jgi:hypothetical protein